MTLQGKRLWAGLGGLGALVVAPYLSGLGILLSLELPWDELRFGLAWAYWRALDLPDFAPYATRIRRGGGIGLALAPSAWLAIVGTAWWREYRLRPPSVPILARIRALKRIWPRASSGSLPDDASLLIVAPDHPRAFAALLPALRDQAGPLLVVDLEGKLHEAAAGWRAAHGPVQRIAPFGGGMPWNPLAAACHAGGLHAEAVKALVACWYPGRTPLITSLLELAFRALLGVVRDTLRHAGDPATPAPGDLARLAQSSLDRTMLDRLAAQPGITSVTQADLTAWRRSDDDTLAVVERQLRLPLAPFLEPVLDAHTRGPVRALQGTVFLTLPYARRADVVPLLHALLLSFRHAPTLVVHGLDLLPIPPPVRRCLATAMSMKGLLAMHGKRAEAFAKRFRFVAWHGPGRRLDLDAEIEALRAYATAHGHYGERLATDAFRTALRRLRPQKQVVFSPLLWPPVRCPVVTAPSLRPTTSPAPYQGEPMILPAPIAALVASLAFATTTPIKASVISASAIETSAIPTELISLGPYRFRLPLNMFDGQYPQNPRRTAVLLVLRWPTLQPFPMGVNFYENNEDFISTLKVHVSHLEDMNEHEASTQLRSRIRPSPRAKSPFLEDPSDNLDMRIRGEVRYDLTPYYVDIDRLKAFNQQLFGSDTLVNDVMNDLAEDWYLRMGPRETPLTLITCSARHRIDTVRIAAGHLVDDAPERRHLLCEHQFYLPRYKALVRVTYLRVILPEWKRIEERVISILHDAEASE